MIRPFNDFELGCLRRLRAAWLALGIDRYMKLNKERTWVMLELADHFRYKIPLVELFATKIDMESMAALANEPIVEALKKERAGAL
jgi:hypothetical protein